MRLRDGLIAGRSHLVFIALLIGLFLLLQWLDQMENAPGAAGPASMPPGPAASSPAD